MQFPVAFDDFNRANGDLGANWSDSLPVDDLVIASNEVAANSSVDNNVKFWNVHTFESDHYSKVSIVNPPSGSSSWMGPVVRADASDAIWLQCTDVNGGLEMTWYDGGNFTALGAVYSGGGWADNDVALIEAVGKKVMGYQNGTLRVSAVNASIPTDGSPGIMITDTTGRLDNWEGGNVHSVSFLQQHTDTVDRTVYTFASANLGVAAPNRHVVVAIGARKSGTPGTISSVTIGGVTANIVGQVSNVSDSNNTTCGLVIAKVPTGATGDIVVTLSTGFLRCAISVYRATGLVSLTPTNVLTSTADDPTVNLDIAAHGFAIGASMFTGSGQTMSWSNLTEDVDFNLETFSAFSSAHQIFESAQTDLALTGTTSGTSTSAAIFASWQFGYMKKIAGIYRMSTKKIGSIGIANIKKLSGIPNG